MASAIHSLITFPPPALVIPLFCFFVSPRVLRRQPCQLSLPWSNLSVSNDHRCWSDASFLSGCVVSQRTIFVSLVIPGGLVGVYPDFIPLVVQCQLSIKDILLCHSTL